MTNERHGGGEPMEKVEAFMGMICVACTVVLGIAVTVAVFITP
jgi:hypothetical protein